MAQYDLYKSHQNAHQSNDDYPFQDPTLPTDVRLANLMSLLTLEEKIDMLWMDKTTRVAYGNISVLPQGTGIAATWNEQLIFEAGVMISNESMAIHYNFKNKSDYKTGASSIINLARDPRWGRVPETYGECPILTGEIAVGFNKGLMGYAKLEDTQLVFVNYDGPDAGRFSFNAIISDADLRLTYLLVWKKLVDEKAIVGVMSAISYVMSDCDPIPDIQKSFHYTAKIEQATAVSVASGNDINCSPEFKLLHQAVTHGFVDVDTINLAISRSLRSRF